MTPRAETVVANVVQRGLWPLLRDAPPAVASAVRALHCTGAVDTERLLAAAAEVARRFPVINLNLVEAKGELELRHSPTTAPVAITDLRGVASGARDEASIQVLRAERDRSCDPAHDRLARFHLVRLADDEIVLGLAAHRLVLDVPSLYLILGAVWQCYFDRFRIRQYRTYPEFAGLDPLAAPTTARARRRWWTRQLEALADAGRSDRSSTASPDGRQTEVERLVLPARRWQALNQASAALGCTGPLAIVGLVAWWLRMSGTRTAIGFGTDLDLRDYLELGLAVGPFTDQAVFAVDLADGEPLSFREVLLRTQTGFLDSVIRYLPHGALVQLATGLGRVHPPRIAELWDVVIHFCRNPPTSSVSARVETAERLGIAFELFAEAELLSTGAEFPAARWDGVNLDIRMGESGRDMAIIAEFNALRFTREQIRQLLDALQPAIDQAITDPTGPLPRVPRLTEQQPRRARND